MLIGFVIINHYSKYRKYGREILNDLLNDISKFVKNKYKIIIVDNGSDTKLKLNDENITLIHIEDQSISGLTGAWNIGVNKAIEEQCDLIYNINDDLRLNDSINYMYDHIINDNKNKFSVYSCYADDACPQQVRNGPIDEVVDTCNIKFKTYPAYPLNGFFWAFTKECWNKYQVDGNFYGTRKDIYWGGQEEEFLARNYNKGLKMYIIGKCYLHHKKKRSWKDTRERYNHPRRMVDFWEEKNKCYRD